MVVLIVDSDVKDAQALSTFLRTHGHLPIITDTVKSALTLLRKEPPDLVLLAMNGRKEPALELLDVSRSLGTPPPVIVTTRTANLDDAVLAMKKGAHDFWVKPVALERLSKTIEWMEGKSPKPGQGRHRAVPSIIAQDTAMLALSAMARRVASSNATVFIQGESGTGKELFARFIHAHSGRKDKPFVALNCAALPEHLLESELFGYEKGAFTGAIKTKEGKFELAHTGTLLLDEVTEIPVHLQAKLLRVLQEGEVDRLGGRHPVPVDVRVIATTNVTIEESLREGRFRKDLYYRLNVIPLKIPPLRDRPNDIGLLAQHFVTKYSRLHQACVSELTTEALTQLQRHAWPGNVRELQNVIQRAVLLSSHARLSADCLLYDHEGGRPSSTGAEIELMSISEMEKRMIHKALATSEGNRTRAAEILGISVRTLRNKLQEYRQSQGL